MAILIHSKTLQVTRGMRRFVTQQAGRLLKFPGQRIEDVHVFIDSIKLRRGKMTQDARVKVKVSLPGKDVIVTSKAHDLYLAILTALKDAKRIIRKRKEKKRGR